MAEQLLNTPDDLNWLRSTHLCEYNGRLSKLPEWRSAVIEGNEDFPDKISLYRQHSPRLMTAPIAVLTMIENAEDRTEGDYAFFSRFEAADEKEEPS